MTIKKDAFDDAQLMAQAAVVRHNPLYWAAAMLALKEAYGK